MSFNRRNAKTKKHVATSSRSVPYDLQLPENKTVKQLKADLTNRGITFPVSAKKSSLIKLWKQNPDATTVTDTAPVLYYLKVFRISVCTSGSFLFFTFCLIFPAQFYCCSSIN